MNQVASWQACALTVLQLVPFPSYVSFFASKPDDETCSVKQFTSRDLRFSNLEGCCTLNDINLGFRTSEFPPLLDSRIQFAKRWQDSTKIRTAWGNIHIFAGMAVEATREDLQIMHDDMSDLLSGNV